MTVLPAQLIRQAMPVSPLFERGVIRGRSYGLSCCGYDVRIREDRLMWPGRFCLASTVEWFRIPNNMTARVEGKSTWEREGIDVAKTIIEPGWKGYLTLEIKSKRQLKWVRLRAGDPIAQIVFEYLTEPTEQPYGPEAKYQDQPPRPVGALKEVIR